MAKKPSKKASTAKAASQKSSAQPAKPSAFASKPWLSYVSIFVGVLVLLALYFSPVFKGQKLQQGDIQSYAGMSYEAREYREATGEQAFWTNSMFGGMPTYHAGLQYPGNLFKSVLKVWRKTFKGPIGFVFLMFLGFFALLSSLRVGPWLSALGGLAFAFSSYFFIILVAGHTSKAMAIGLMPLVVAGILYAYRGKLLLGFVITAAAMTLEVAANHYQITYYLGISVLILGLCLMIDAIRNKTLPQFAIATGTLVGAVLLALLPNISMIWTTSEYVSSTIRGKSELSQVDGGKESPGLDKDYAYQWSYGVGESFSLMMADFLGGASGTKVPRGSDTYEELRKLYGNNVNQVASNFPTYWGDQPFTSGPVYVGAIICFLFVVGIVLVEGPMMWWLLASTILFIMLSWGRNMMWFSDLFFYYFPMYNKFRAVSMAMVIAEFTMPLLGILGLYKLVNYKQEGIGEKKALNALKIAGGVVGGLALFFLVLGSSIMDFSGPIDSQFQQNPSLLNLLIDHRASMMQGDAFRALFLVAASVGLLWFYVKGNVKKPVLVAALLVLSVGDMWTVNKRYLDNDDFGRREAYKRPNPTPASQAILQDKDPNYRVLNFFRGNFNSTFNSAATAYFHKDVGGYHPAKLRRYQDLIERNIRPEMRQVVQGFQSAPTDSSIQALLANSNTLNFLNTRYLIIADDQRPIRNQHALGNAWFVSNLKMVDDADQEIAAIQNFDPSVTAVVDKRYGDRLEGFRAQVDPTASISMTEYSPNKLVYQCQASSEAIAIFSEMYYNDTKGWNAYIDGEYTPHFRADYVLRGLRVPAGTHSIEFRMEPNSYSTGELISLISSILLLLLLAAAAFLEWRNRKGDSSEK